MKIKRQEEQWKDLEGIWGRAYQISNKGRMKRKERVIKTSNGKGVYEYTLPEMILSQRTNKIHPHLFCDLTYNKKRRSAYVHKEVAIAFIEAPKETIRLKAIGNTGYHKKSVLRELYVEHIDNDHTNNVPENLRWINQLDLYNKQIERGRIPKMDLYKHSSRYKGRGQSLKESL